MNAPQERPGRIDYLYLTESQKVVVGEMNEQIDNLPPMVRLRCQSPEVRDKGGKTILYFPHVDYDERTPPNAAEADLMCKTAGRMCPIAATCLKLGLELEAPVGVWGGRTIVDGTDYNGGK